MPPGAIPLCPQQPHGTVLTEEVFSLNLCRANNNTQISAPGRKQSLGMLEGQVEDAQLQLNTQVGDTQPRCQGSSFMGTHQALAAVSMLVCCVCLGGTCSTQRLVPHLVLGFFRHLCHLP